MAKSMVSTRIETRTQFPCEERMQEKCKFFFLFPFFFPSFQFFYFTKNLTSFWHLSWITERSRYGDLCEFGAALESESSFSELECQILFLKHLAMQRLLEITIPAVSGNLLKFNLMRVEEYQGGHQNLPS